MVDNIKAKNVTVEIDEIFTSIRIEATDVDLFEDQLLFNRYQILFTSMPLNHLVI